MSLSRCPCQLQWPCLRTDAAYRKLALAGLERYERLDRHGDCVIAGGWMCDGVGVCGGAVSGVGSELGNKRRCGGITWGIARLLAPEPEQLFGGLGSAHHRTKFTYPRRIQLTSRATDDNHISKWRPTKRNRNPRRRASTTRLRTSPSPERYVQFPTSPRHTDKRRKIRPTMSASTAMAATVHGEDGVQHIE